MEKRTITQSIEKFIEGRFDIPDRSTQIDAGWYDWFCKDSALPKKTDKLYRRLIQIAKSKKFDPDKTYVFFKNNCPMKGPLYDSFSICDIETGQVLYWVTPKSGHTGKAEVASKESEFETAVSGTWKDVIKYFLG